VGKNDFDLMYEQLGDVSYTNTDQLIGYVRLLQVSLNEHY